MKNIIIQKVTLTLKIKHITKIEKLINYVIVQFGVFF